MKKIKIKRLNTINVNDGSSIIDYELPITPDSDYVVDDSCFVPIAEAIKQLKANNLSGAEIEQTYDFPNGVDTGKSIPVTRRADYSDITELSTAIMEDTKTQVQELEKARDKKRRQDKFDSELKELNNLPTSPTLPINNSGTNTVQE